MSKRLIKNLCCRGVAGRDYLIQQSLNSGSCAGSNPARGVSEICDGKNL